MTSVAKTTTEKLHALFIDMAKLPDGPPTSKKIAIISTPRSGSKLFCSKLTSTGRFGRASEWMNPRYINAYGSSLGTPQKIDLGDYLRFVMAKTTTANGVFSMNFHVEHFIEWQKQGFDILSMRFDRIYRVYREDRLAQALSLAKARITDQWGSDTAPQPETTARTVRRPQVFKALFDISRQDQIFDRHLAKHVTRQYGYSAFTSSDAPYRDLLSDCGIAHKDIESFSSDKRVQSDERDIEALSKLKAYLGIS